MGQPAEYLTPAELAKRWGGAVTTGTLANWRSKSKTEKPLGPPFIKFGGRVRYPLAKVVEWEAKNTHLVGDNDNTEGIEK